jgi:hypothetical protein
MKPDEVFTKLMRLIDCWMSEKGAKLERGREIVFGG